MSSVRDLTLTFFIFQGCLIFSRVCAFTSGTFDDNDYGRICNDADGYNGRTFHTICEDVCDDDDALGSCESVNIEFDDTYLDHEIVRCTKCGGKNKEMCVSAAKDDEGTDAVVTYNHNFSKKQGCRRCVHDKTTYLKKT